MFLEALGYAIFIVPGSVLLLPYTREIERKRWDRTRLASSASKHAIHYAIASRAWAIQPYYPRYGQ